MIDGPSLYLALEIWGCIFCILFVMFLSMNRDTVREEGRALQSLTFCIAMMLLADIVAWEFRGEPGNAAFWAVRVSNFLVFALGYLCVILAAVYLLRVVNEEPSSSLLYYFIMSCGILGLITTVVSQFTGLYYTFDEGNLYHRMPYFWISQVIGIFASGAFGILIFFRRKRMKKGYAAVLMVFACAPAISLAVGIFHYGISFLNVACALSVLAAFFLHIYNQHEASVHAKQDLAAREKELDDMKIQIVLSQIQPHFIFNALNTIYYLCAKNAAVAQQAITDFSDYLRGNMEALKYKNAVPIGDELKHVRSYLALEKLRFDDDLRIRYDIASEEFMIPALTIQPLAENAVKHGIGRKDGGGTLTITTSSEDGAWVVRVEDDGVGFDPEHFMADGKSHIGIENVRERLARMCGGTLTIRSEKGAGTCAEIRIPKSAGNSSSGQEKRTGTPSASL